MDADIFQRLRSVPADRRPIPFWSWNDRLEPEELRRQLREMAAAGVGGFFMHARGGLETEYLGTEWMACVEACLSEAGSLGLQPWLYDEDGWPSGFAGGLVPAKGASFYGRWLTIEHVSDPVAAFAAEGFLALYEVAADKGYRRLGAEDVLKAVARAYQPDPLAEFVAVGQRYTPYYIDVLDPDAVDAFIAETHERYLRRFPEAFGGGRADTAAWKNAGSAVKTGARLAGFFTDEPRFSGSIDRDPPWSLKLPERFRAAYGYDILDHLAALFLPVNGREKIRYDYYALTSALFVSSFTKRIGGWCRAQGVELTGHLMMEESVFVQAANTSGVMPHYEYFDVPGVDWLRRPIGSPVVPKQVGSVAAQLGKKRVITESFALAGWDVGFEELKRIVEWQYVNGVNLLCQHLEGYTLRGFRKRDYPPSLFFQQPWWPEYRVFNEYVGRLGMLLSEGDWKPRVLLLHPMRSGWTLFDGATYTDEFRALDRDFVSACEALSGAHVEYHLGDETIIAGHGRVERGRTGHGEERARFVVGRCSYETVVLPSLCCMASTTLALLEAFSAAGGVVFAAGDLPRLLDGELSARLDAFLKNVRRPPGGPAAVAEELRKELGRREAPPSVRGADGEIAAIHLTERDFGSARVWFLVNLDRECAFESRVELPGAGRLRLYRPEDGTFERCVCTPAGTADRPKTAVTLRFEPMRSRVLVMDDGAADDRPAVQSADVVRNAAEVPAVTGTAPCPIVLGVDGEWEIDSMDDNALTLDSCAYRIDGGPLQPPKPVIHLMRELLELRRPCDIELRFSFNSNLGPSELRTLFLAVERAAEFTLEINGRQEPGRDAGWWKDTSFRKIGILPFVRRGTNEIILRRRFFQSPKVYGVLFGKDVYETEKNKLTYDVELESVYLVGGFAVRAASPFAPGERDSLHTAGPFVLVRRPVKVAAGDLCVQGFPFFSGRVALSRGIEVPALNGRRAVLSMRKPRAVLAAVSVNGVRAATLPWAPWEADLTDFLKPGANRLTIDLWSGNRNLLGPHHHVSGEPYNVGPDSFTGRWSWVEKATEAEPASPESRERSYWKDGYSFVTFGLVP